VNAEIIGGYRVVRKLGEGPRAEVYLGHPDRAGAVPAAIKVYRPGTPTAEVITEVEVLSRARGEHVVELLDVSTAVDGTPALILQQLSATSLSRLLADRSALRAGEAITVLAPLAMTLARLHAAGVSHGAVRPDAIMFDSAGAPVLSSFGRATLVEPRLSPAALGAEPGVRADLAGMAAVADTVLSRVHDDAASEIRAWLPAHVSAPDGWLDSLARRLFEWGEPEAVGFSERAAPAATLPARVLTAEPVAQSPTRAALALPHWITERVDPVVASLATVRTRVWVAAGAAAVALISAILLVPSGGSDATTAPAAVATPVATAAAAPSPVVGDDPVAALSQLLETRARCVRDLSILCLDDVAQASSAALADDYEIISDLQAGGEVSQPWTIDAVTVSERLGDAALITVDDPADSEPASFLLLKGEAGWRIRDYLWQ